MKTKKEKIKELSRRNFLLSPAYKQAIIDKLNSRDKKTEDKLISILQKREEGANKIISKTIKNNPRLEIDLKRNIQKIAKKQASASELRKLKTNI